MYYFIQSRPRVSIATFTGCVFEGKPGWCNRRLLARIHRYTLDRLRKEIEPVSPADFLRFLCSWQHVDPERQLQGPHGTREVIEQLSADPQPETSALARIGPPVLGKRGPL